MMMWEKSFGEMVCSRGDLHIVGSEGVEGTEQGGFAHLFSSLAITTPNRKIYTPRVRYVVNLH